MNTEAIVECAEKLCKYIVTGSQGRAIGTSYIIHLVAFHNRINTRQASRVLPFTPDNLFISKSSQSHLTSNFKSNGSMGNWASAFSYPQSPPQGPSDQGNHPPVVQLPQTETYHMYEHISWPNIDDIRTATVQWDNIAHAENIQYMFSGTTVRRLREPDAFCRCDEIEIVVDSALGDSNHAQYDLERRRPELKITGNTNFLIVVVRENKGVALKFVTRGKDHSPMHFNPPWESLLRTPDQYRDEPTYGTLALGLPGDNRVIPIIHSRYGLLQRLRQLQSTDVGPYHKWRYLHDIRPFLNFCIADIIYPFPTPIQSEVICLVLAYIRYAIPFGFQITEEEVINWRRMGIVLPDAAFLKTEAQAQHYLNHYRQVQVLASQM